MLAGTMKNKSEAAKVLGRLGGEARARALDPERRSAISKVAGSARWAGHQKVLRATHVGRLLLGGVEVPCANLVDGRRVISHTAFVEALGRARPGGQTYQRRANENGRDELPIFLALKCLKDFIPNDFSVATIAYHPSGGGPPAMGIDATAVPVVCRIWLSALAARKLRRDQIQTAKQAGVILAGMAEVGIVALVDEATGFQRDRAADALASILEAFIGKELAKWVKTFDDDYYRELCRLKGARYDELSSQRPQWMGTVTNNIVYDRLAPGVLKKLKEVNPRIEGGNRKAQHHRWLTRETGYPELREHLTKVTLLMSLCSTWDEFMTILDERIPKWGAVLRLPLPFTKPSRMHALTSGG